MVSAVSIHEAFCGLVRRKTLTLIGEEGYSLFLTVDCQIGEVSLQQRVATLPFLIAVFLTG